MELNQPPPSSQNPDSDLSHQAPPAQPLAGLTSSPPPDDLYHRISSYPFHSDQDYQLGLAAILGHPETLSTPTEIASNQDLVLQAQCFYLARKFNLGQIDVAAYKEWLAVSQKAKEAQAHEYEHGTNANENVTKSPVERPSAPTPSTAAAAPTLPSQPHTQAVSSSTLSAARDPDPAPPYPTSFADIVDLITQNKPIPGIEEVPDTVLEPGSSKQDKAARRKKPWEQNETPIATESDRNKEGKEEQEIDIEHRKQTGEGVMKILQPGAVPDSGLIAKEAT